MAQRQARSDFPMETPGAGWGTQLSLRAPYTTVHHWRKPIHLILCKSSSCCSEIAHLIKPVSHKLGFNPLVIHINNHCHSLVTSKLLFFSSLHLKTNGLIFILCSLKNKFHKAFPLLPLLKFFYSVSPFGSVFCSLSVPISLLLLILRN